MKMISFKTLIKIVSVTGFVVGGTGYAFRLQIQKELRESKIYKNAIQYLYNHQEALDLLGTPIKEKNVNISDFEKNGTDKNKTWLTIPIMGSLNSGELCVEVLINENLEKKLKTDIYKVELKLAETPDKVLVIKDDSTTIAN